MSSAIAAAIDLARKGFAVFPIKARDKIPATGHGFKDSSSDPETVENLFANRPNCNVGIATGPASGAWVLDVEAAGIADLEKLQQQHGELPKTLTSITGGGGRHLFFAYNGREIRNKAKIKGMAIDVRGDGGYVVVPPSVHNSGRSYEWQGEADTPIVAAPGWLVDLVVGDTKKVGGSSPGINPPKRDESAGKTAVDRCRKYLGKMPDAISGQGGHGATLAAAAECFRFGLSQGDALELMQEFNATKTGGEPWNDRELEHKLTDARAKVEAAGEFGCRLSSKRNGRDKGNSPKPKRDESAGATAVIPTIDASEKDLATITPKVIRAIIASNNPPTLFRHAGMPSRIETGDAGEPHVRALNFDRMRHEISRRMRCETIVVRGESETVKLIAPPKDMVNDVLATPDIGLPILTRIVEAPVFAPDGSLQTEPGYHEAAGVYFRPAQNLVIPDVADHPSDQQIAEARGLIRDELLGDFPFVGDSEAAHAAAVILQPFCRDLIDGSTPLFLYEKPTAGTGATLLVDVSAYPATGRPIPAMTEGRDEDEWRKRLTAKLLGMPSHSFIDNLRKPLDSAAVASAITSPMWEDRILGVSGMARIPVKCVWLATGNNPQVSGEIARRSIRIRMDPKQDRPWLRTTFRHPDLRGWAKENRGRLVWAALTLIRAWIAAGRPAGSKTLGMFESWAKTMGGILDVAGIDGFLGNIESFYEDTDTESAVWRNLLLAWFDKFNSRDVLAKELFPLAIEAGIELGGGNEQSQRIALGKLLADRRERIFDVQATDRTLRLRIVKGDTYRRAALWKCECVSECESIPTPTHARAHAHECTEAVGNTHTDSHTHTDDGEPEEVAYDPWN